MNLSRITTQWVISQICLYVVCSHSNSLLSKLKTRCNKYSIFLIKSYPWLLNDTTQFLSLNVTHKPFTKTIQLTYHKVKWKCHKPADLTFVLGISTSNIILTFFFFYQFLTNLIFFYKSSIYRQIWICQFPKVFGF